jgi:hypothetical protein
MRVRPFAAMDALSLLLVVFGATLLAMAIVGSVVLAQPVPPPPAEIAEPSDLMNTQVGIDVTVGTAAALRVGDHVDVLGYFVGQASGQDNVTRLLIADVPVASISRAGGTPALLLALPPASVLVLHEAEALGVKPLVVVRALDTAAAEYPGELTDSELVAKLTEVVAHAP